MGILGRANALLNNTQVVKYSNFLAKSVLQTGEGRDCIVSLVELLESDSVVSTGLFERRRLDHLLLRVLLASLHCILVAFGSLVDPLHLIVNHANIVPTFGGLSSEKLTFSLVCVFLLHAVLERLQGQAHLLIELEVEKPKIEVGFNVFWVDLKGALVQPMQSFK